jgi:hypothetical protein
MYVKQPGEPDWDEYCGNGFMLRLTINVIGWSKSTLFYCLQVRLLKGLLQSRSVQIRPIMLLLPQAIIFLIAILIQFYFVSLK